MSPSNPVFFFQLALPGLNLFLGENIWNPSFTHSSHLDLTMQILSFLVLTSPHLSSYKKFRMQQHVFSPIWTDNLTSLQFHPNDTGFPFRTVSSSKSYFWFTKLFIIFLPPPAHSCQLIGGWFSFSIYCTALWSTAVVTLLYK